MRPELLRPQTNLPATGCDCSMFGPSIHVVLVDVVVVVVEVVVVVVGAAVVVLWCRLA